MILGMEKQVCSLELAKRLKKLGVKQFSLFYWRDYKSDAGIELCYAPNIFHENAVTIYDYYSAFTVAELGKLLPVYVTKLNTVYEILICISDEEYVMDMNNEEEFVLHTPRKYQICYKSLHDDICLNNFGSDDENEANARAKMLIYLLENGLIENE